MEVLSFEKSTAGRLQSPRPHKISVQCLIFTEDGQRDATMPALLQRPQSSKKTFSSPTHTIILCAPWAFIKGHSSSTI